MNDAEKFLSLLIAERPDESFVEVARINGSAPVAKGVKTVADAMKFVQATPDNYDLYASMNTRRKRMAKHAGESDVDFVMALSVDCDKGMPDFDSVFAPSIVVKSGGMTPEGEDRVQAHWLLREPFAIESERDKGRVKAINIELAHLYAGDSTQSIDHLYRMPGTWNWCKRQNGTSKVPEGVDVPRMSSILTWEPERRYDLTDFEEWLGLDGLGILAADLPEVAFSDDDLDAERVLQECIDAGISPDTVAMIVDGVIPDGKSRSDRDMSVIGRLISDVIGITDDEIKSLFIAFGIGDRYSEKGQGDRYLRISIAKARAHVPDDDEEDAPDVEVQPEPAQGYQGPRLPEIAWHPAFALYRRAVGASTEAADEHHFAAFRIIAGAALGRRVWTHYGRRHYAGGYALLIGPTHDKKTTSQRRAADLIVDLEFPFGTLASLSSAEGLVEWLAKQDMTGDELAKFIDYLGSTDGSPWEALNPTHRRGLLVSEEFAGVLQKARTDGSSQLITMITQLYDMPDWLEPPLRTRRIVAEKPTLSILGASTPDWMVRNLKEADVLGGFANRFQVYTGPPKDPMPWPQPPDAALLEDVIGTIDAMCRHWKGEEFTLSDAARGEWDDFYFGWVEQARADGELPTSKLESRIPEHTVKLALLYAAFDQGQAVISRSHMEAAIAVGLYLRESVRYAFADTLDTGEPPAAKLERAMLKALSAGPLKKRELQSRTKQRHTTSSDFARVLDGLVKSRIVAEESKSGIVRLRND